MVIPNVRTPRASLSLPVYNRLGATLGSLAGPDQEAQEEEDTRELGNIKI